MPGKQIAYDQEAREGIRRGVSKLARAVKATLGPRGRLAVIERKFGSPTVTKDGVTVAKEIELEDVIENIGAQMVKDVASKTSDVAGDGTTTATVLAEAIFEEGLRNVTAGANPLQLKRGMEKAVEAVVAELKKASRQVKDDPKAIEQVAAIAANNDREIGEKIREAMDRVGKDGSITVEEGKGISTTVEFVEGLQFDKGWLSPYFVTDQAEMTAVLEDAYVLVHEKKISALKDVLPLLERVAQSGKTLLVVAEEVEGEALATLVVNKLRGTLKCCAVKAPGFGDRRKSMLEDIAIVTGGRAVLEDVGVKLENLKLEDLGRAKKVVIEKEATTVIQGAGTKQAIQGRIAQIKAEIETTTSTYDKEKLEERLAKLAGGVAQIEVGAATESEMKEKKARVEDALHATRAAVEEGIVPGGGVALLRAGAAIGKLSLGDDEKVGAEIVRRALERPLIQIAENSGLDGTVVLEKVRAGKDASFGFNAETLEYGDLVKQGVVDPAKVARCALQNAASVASMLLTTEAVVARIPEKRKKSRMPAGGGEDMGGGFGGEDDF